MRDIVQCGIVIPTSYYDELIGVAVDVLVCDCCVQFTRTESNRPHAESYPRHVEWITQFSNTRTVSKSHAYNLAHGEIQ